MLRIPKGKKQTKAHARAPYQEKEIAKRLDAGLVRRSGAGDVKGDVRKRRVMRIECKTTMKGSFKVTLEMIQKIEHAALMSTELPAILIEFINWRGKRLTEIAVVPSYVLDLIANGNE